MANKKQFILITVEGALLLGLMYWFLIQQTSTFKIFYEIYSPQVFYFSSYVGLSLLSMIFFGLNLAVAAESWEAFKKNNLKHKTAAGASTFLSLFGAACPTCGAFLLSAFGLGSLSVLLPLKGMEFLIGSTIFLAGTFWLSWRKLNSFCQTCIVTDKKIPLSSKAVIHLSVFLVIVSTAYFLLQKELLI